MSRQGLSQSTEHDTRPDSLSGLDGDRPAYPSAKGFLKRELSGIGLFLKRNASESIIIFSSTLSVILYKYRPIQNDWLSSVVYFGAFPLLVVTLLLRRNPLDFGLRPGNVRIWAVYVFVFCAVAGAGLYAASYDPGLRAFYRTTDFSFVAYSLTTVATLAASEFLYRGFLLFGLKERFGESSILIQMVPFALVHIGKPGLETVSTLVTGVLFGYVAFRGRSYWPAFLIHLFINLFFVALVNYRLPA